VAGFFPRLSPFSLALSSTAKAAKAEAEAAAEGLF